MQKLDYNLQLSEHLKKYHLKEFHTKKMIKYSIFKEYDLRKWYQNDNLVVIKMTYNIALAKRITRGMLLDEAGISPTLYWGFFQLTDNQFDYILKKGNVNENFIIG